MRVKSYTEAVRLANAAGLDAAKRRMKKAGRKVMSASDYDHAVGVTEGILTALGFDVAGWAAVAGIKRNEPDEPPARRKTAKRSSSRASAPVQLSLPF